MLDEPITKKELIESSSCFIDIDMIKAAVTKWIQ